MNMTSMSSNMMVTLRFLYHLHIPTKNAERQRSCSLPPEIDHISLVLSTLSRGWLPPAHSSNLSASQPYMLQQLQSSENICKWHELCWKSVVDRVSPVGLLTNHHHIRQGPTKPSATSSHPATSTLDDVEGTGDIRECDSRRASTTIQVWIS